MFMPRLRANSLGWQVYQDLGSAIVSLGHDFRFLTVGLDGQDMDGHAIHLNHSRGWKHLGRVSASALRTRLLLPDAAALRRYLLNHGDEVEILHVENAYPDGVAALAAASLSGWKGKLVLKPMGEDVLVVPQAHYGFRRFMLPRALVSWALWRADAVRCSSSLVQTEVAAIGIRGVSRVVPICVTNQTVAAAEESVEARTHRKQSERAALDKELGTFGEPVIVTLGRLHPFKGLEVLIEALALLPKGRLVVAGPSLTVKPVGDYTEHLVRLATDMGVRGRVNFLGPVAPTASINLLAAADVVAIPSHFESHNKVAIEAAAVGTPFVVTETTGVAAAVPDEGIGVVVPPASPKALALALSQILDKHWRHNPMRASAFAERYAPGVIAKELLDLYKTILR